jgi:hypothetical protein
MGDDDAPRERVPTSGLLGFGLVLFMLGAVVTIAFANTALQGLGIVAGVVGVVLLAVWIVLLVRARLAR